MTYSHIVPSHKIGIEVCVTAQTCRCERFRAFQKSTTGQYFSLSSASILSPIFSLAPTLYQKDLGLFLSKPGGREKTKSTKNKKKLEKLGVAWVHLCPHPTAPIALARGFFGPAHPSCGSRLITMTFTLCLSGLYYGCHRERKRKD